MEILLQILKNWWWFFFSFVLFFLFKFFYFWWIRWEVFYKKTFKWILLEIVPPKEVKKPFSAMENVFSMLWGIIDVPNWRERWCRGGFYPLGYGGWFSFELCSFGGEIHFFMRIPAPFKSAAETAIFSQYPEAEIFEVKDYTKKVPQDIPNEKWDLYSEDYVLTKPDHFPIKTYSVFFERPEEEKRIPEEKRIDPMDALLEALSQLQSGEQIWLQIVCNPIMDTIFPWMSKGRAEIEKITKRKSPQKPKSIFDIVFETLIIGKRAEKITPAELIAPELRLTPGEREVLRGIEEKLKRNAYQCWIRVIHVYRKDKPYDPGSVKLVREYLMGQFSAPNSNWFVYFGGTRTRIHYWLQKRRLYLRKRQRFREYVERLPSYFPWNFRGDPPPLIKLIRYRVAPGFRATSILSTEELATIFHFPAKIILPTVPRVEVKKVGPPPALP